LAQNDNEDDFTPVEADASCDMESSWSIDVVNDCDDKTYYGVCFGFLSCIVISAIMLDDLSFIFGMIAAFSESMLNFVLPGLFFLTALSYVQVESKGLKFVAFLFTLLGLTYFATSNYFNFIKFTRI